MGFFAVLAASLFAVFLFTVFGGYSLLLWCQQSLWMVVPPALVLAVLVWTFLKWTTRSPPCKSGWRSWNPHRKTPKSPKNKIQRRPCRRRFPGRGGAFFTTYFLSCGSSNPLNITMPRIAKLAPSTKPTVPSVTLNKTPMATPNRIPAI